MRIPGYLRKFRISKTEQEDEDKAVAVAVTNTTHSEFVSVKKQEGEIPRDYSLPPVILAVSETMEEAEKYSTEVFPKAQFLNLFGWGGKMALSWFQRRQKAAGMLCPYCRTQITKEDDISGCAKCLTVHHRECWNELGKCSCFGCSSAVPISNEGTSNDWILPTLNLNGSKSIPHSRSAEELEQIWWNILIWLSAVLSLLVIWLSW